MKTTFFKIYFFVLFSISGFQSYAQANISYKTINKQAREYFGAANYEAALPLYLQLDSLKPGNTTIAARTGICYLHTDFNFKALPYMQVAEKAGYSQDNFHYFLGHAYHLDHQFDKAISYFERSKTQLDQRKKEDQSRIRRIERLVQMCMAGKELIQHPIKVQIDNLGPNINSPYPDYAPVISADETILIFTSRRPNTTGGLKDESQQYFEDIYISTKEDNEWTVARNIGSPINTAGHDASVGLSADGRKLLIYKPDGGGDIYHSILQGKTWSLPVKMPGINTSQSWEPSASISPNEQLLFFASDRQGGYGGRDIYVSQKLPDGEWGTPKNLGPDINTPYDEDAPFIHPDGMTLYFSSKGHNSMGGFDIFTVKYNPENNQVSDLKNLGYPINTAADDVFFVWSADGARGYFSSVRAVDNYGGKDIYKLTRPKEDVALIILAGKVLSKGDEQPLNAIITVTDNETQNIVTTYHTDQYSGRYIITIPPGKSYGISVQAAGYMPVFENITLKSAYEYLEEIKDFLMTPVQEGNTTVLKNVFFDEESSELRKESYVELDKLYSLLNENPALNIEIASHVVNKSQSENVNISLSQKRALVITEYLAGKGIKRERLCAKGYGSRYQEIIGEKQEVKESTEAIILSTQLSQNSNCEGFYTLAVRNQKKEVENKELATQQLKNSEPILFATNSDELTKQELPKLEKVITFLKGNKEFRVQLAGHTDDRGTEQYNELLAQRRIEAVSRYLISRGLSMGRIETFNYGEKKAVGDNKTITGRAQNRRVEITFIP